MSVKFVKSTFYDKTCPSGEDKKINLRYIQEILGHNSSRTTEIYAHVTNHDSRSIASPLEKITFNKSTNTQRDN